MNARLIIGIVFFMLFVGMIAGNFYTQESEIDKFTLNESGEVESPAWYVAWIPIAWIPWLVDKAPDPVQFIFDSIVTFIALVTFQLDGVPVEVNTLIFIPFAFGLGWLVFGLIRGAQ